MNKHIIIQRSTPPVKEFMKLYKHKLLKRSSKKVSMTKSCTNLNFWIRIVCTTNQRIHKLPN